MQNQEFVTIKHKQTVMARYQLSDEYVVDKTAWLALMEKHNQNKEAALKELLSSAVEYASERSEEMDEVIKVEASEIGTVSITNKLQR